MPDPRFFKQSSPLSLSDLASLTGASIQEDGGAAVLSSVAPLAQAGGADVTFLSGRRYLPSLAETGAGACFVSPEFADAAPDGCQALVTGYPQAAWALAADSFFQPIRHDPAAPAIHPEAQIETGVEIGQGVVIGQGARIGSGSRLGPGTVIGPGVTLGRGCRIGPRVVIGFALIGDGVAMSAGAVIGEAGFGAAAGPRGVVDIPQLGRVILQDNVTVGANCCIDRGAYDDTVVGENTKIDNLVHIAHNTRIGRNCVMAAFVGISGSVTVGDGVSFGGKAGIADHVTIGSGASIGAGAGIIKNVPPGEIWSGYPGRPVREWLKETAWVARATRRKG
jgi:UDP-3-O-[3-hydroxymyristoyl] glucosamine N-acyltransferase